MNITKVEVTPALPPSVIHGGWPGAHARHTCLDEAAWLCWDCEDKAALRAREKKGSYYLA